MASNNYSEYEWENGLSYAYELGGAWATSDPRVAKNAAFIMNYMLYWGGKPSEFDPNGRPYIKYVPSAIAGIIGNMVFESKCNPAVARNGGATWHQLPNNTFGLCQWHPWWYDSSNPNTAPSGLGMYYNVSPNINDSLRGYCGIR